MKVSVIIPTYNESRDIDNCLKSLEEQSIKFETIVVDDGSTDDTEKIINNFPVKLLKQSHLGPAKARNLGAQHANGEILVFIDADMTFDKDFLKNLVTPIIENRAIGTFSKLEKVANPHNLWSICWNINRNLPPNQMLPSNYPNHQTVFRAILKSAFLKVNGFDSVGYNDDWSLSEKLHQLALNAPSAIFFHRNPDNLLEVWQHAAWVARRKYKSYLMALLRFTIPVSIIIGIYKSFKFQQPFFLIFKIIYDFSAFISLLHMSLTGKKYI